MQGHRAGSAGPAQPHPPPSRHLVAAERGQRGCPKSIALRRLAQTPRRPNELGPTSVAPYCRRRGDQGAHVAVSLPARRQGFVQDAWWVRSSSAPWSHSLPTTLPQFEPVAGWSSSGRTFGTGQIPRTAAVRDYPTTGSLRVLSRNRRRGLARNGPLGAAIELPGGCRRRAPIRLICRHAACRKFGAEECWHTSWAVARTVLVFGFCAELYPCTSRQSGAAVDAARDHRAPARGITPDTEWAMPTSCRRLSNRHRYRPHGDRRRSARGSSRDAHL